MHFIFVACCLPLRSLSDEFIWITPSLDNYRHFGVIQLAVQLSGPVEVLVYQRLTVNRIIFAEAIQLAVQLENFNWITGPVEIDK